MRPVVTAAIVGAGPAGLLHALSLRAAGARIARVVDRDLARAEALSELVGARAGDDLGAVAAERFDVVTVASPPRLHVEHALALAGAARRLVVEKPLATTPSELEALSSIEHLVPVLQWREGRGLRAVRAAMDASCFGEHPSVSVDVTLARDAEYRRLRCGSLDWGAGALLSVGIHALDAACFALGRAPDRALSLAARAPGEQVESSGVVAVSAGGALVSLRVTFGGGASRVRLAFSGAGLTATILGSESDPTARLPRWQASSRAERARAVAFGEAIRGGTSPPLVVPFFARVVASCSDARALRELPTLADVAASHLALMDPTMLA